jgi:hypothetical protein
MILHHPLRRALSILATCLAISAVLDVLRQHHLVSAEAAVRLMGMLIGSVVFVCANAIPKTLVPLARLSCAPAREQTLRRLCGWAGVLGGLGCTLAYALAPIGVAGGLAKCFMTPAAVVMAVVMAGVMMRCAWARSARRSGT